MNSFQILTDLVNLDKSKVTYERATDFLTRWSFGFNGWGTYGAQLRSNPRTYVFWDQNEMVKTMERIPPRNSIGNAEISLVMADSPIVKEQFLYMFSKQCHAASIFAYKCRDTKSVPLDLINEKFAIIQTHHAILRFSGPIERPTLSLINVPIPYAALEDELEIKAYLVPFLAGKGDKWLRSKDCEECGKFFFYKLDRARFCSKTCRIRYNNKARKDK